MTTVEALACAQSRFLLAKAMGDEPEARRWSEQVADWKFQLRTERQEAGGRPLLGDSFYQEQAETERERREDR